MVLCRSLDPAAWDLSITGLVESPLKLTWKKINRVPEFQRTSDFHCVTRWSRFDNHWDSVVFMNSWLTSIPSLRRLTFYCMQNKDSPPMCH